MKPIYLTHHDIDKKKWDDCIQRSPNGMVYAESWYLDIVSPGWNALADADYRTVFPLTWRKKMGFYYLYQPFFTQQLGIFSGDETVAEKTIHDFLNEIPVQYRLVEIQLNSANTCHYKDFKISGRLTHHLDLNQSVENIRGSYSENLDRNIKRAVKSQLELSFQIKPEEIIQIFKENRGKNIDNLGKKEYSMLFDLIHEAKKRNLITLIGAKTPTGKFCAGAVFLESTHEFIFLFSAADKESRNTGAMSFIIDSFINAHAGETKTFDFEGSMNQNLARFYKSFGSKEVVYLQIKKNNLPAYVKWFKK